MHDTIRDAPLGQTLRFLSGRRLFKYPEERAGFELPLQYVAMLKGNKIASFSSSPNEKPIDEQSSTRPRAETLAIIDGDGSEDIDLEAMQAMERVETVRSVRTVPYTAERMRVEQMLQAERTKSIPIIPQTTETGAILVDWYTTDDTDNPTNWSSIKKSTGMFILCFYTWVVYCAGPIYVASEGSGMLQEFHISPVAASLRLSLYILAYGIGDLLFSPLTEIPVVGRNHVYYLTFIVFFAISFGPPVVSSFSGLLVLRFWMGFFGSPALANGGATVGDMYSLIYIPYGLCWWVLSAWCGPALGPLFGGFAGAAKGWRWPMWEIVWMSAPLLLILLCFMPETSAATILLHRARRLRKLTGDARFQSQSEIDQQNLSAQQILTTALIRPIEIMLRDPSIFFVNLYTGYFYAVFYTFFEVFPLVYPPMYGFNLGETGLAFLSCLIGVLIALVLYFCYLTFYMVPDNKKPGFREQEHRLVPAIAGSFLLPIGLFIFAWTANPRIHWAVSLVGVGVFVIGHFFTLQSLFICIPFSYPQYAASLFAGNSVWRSATACASVIFARPLFVNLGFNYGTTLLACLSVLGIFGTVAIYVFGKQLRARSKFAVA